MQFIIQIVWVADRKLLCTPTKEGQPESHPARLPPSSSPSHQPIPGPSPQAQRSRSPKADGGTQITDSEEGTAVPGEPQPHRPGVTPILGNQLQRPLAGRWSVHQGTGQVWDCMRLTMGCLGGEQKVGKGKDLDESWRNKCGKIEG